MIEKYPLSVIIASYNSGKTIKDCLKSLEDQVSDKDFEVIIVDSSPDDNTAKFIKERFPRVNVYKFQERKYCGDARNFGISVAKGEVIAFIDADCRADSNWVNEIIKAHQSACVAIGGAIANGNPTSYVGWAAYFCEFSQWMPSLHAKWLRDIAGANMSYKREVFKKYGAFIEGTYCSDTEYHWRLEEKGYRLRFVPSILIFHHNIDNLSKFLIHEYHHGQSFARVRTTSQRFSRLRRFLYVIFSPLITLKLFFKIGFINFKNRVYLLSFLKVLPLFTLGLISWSLGECVSYAKG
ncbi:MAG: glycosyl transferase, family 2 [Candidatus Jettenia ecosi]|uniref:Glycosyl transferase, family 2 n=1 Tax=Candidatus Jettenia ecosi TaxID=2494326 RepID=A0A533QFI2_9BACT|nr:MAG: glycosyl transferase, family 2 [Candidatus Jettenia ecosi]